MDYNLVQKSVHHHGHCLVDALRVEQGDQFLTNVSVANTGPEETFRPIEQGNLSNERAQMLVSFIAQKADMLFKRQHRMDALVVSQPAEVESKDSYAILPPLECYMDVSEVARKKHFYQSLVKGDIVVGSVAAKHTHGLIITLLCLWDEKMRYIHDLNLKCFCNLHQIPPLSVHEDPLEAYHFSDLIRGVVLEVNSEAEKIYISMKDASLATSIPQQQVKLGLINEEDLPYHYKESLKFSNVKYDDKLKSTLGFMNPSIVSHLSNMMGLNLTRPESLMRGLHGKDYPKEEYAKHIYKVQCGKWAYKSVKQGVHHFKSGNTVEAFQCLNKALQIDPQNVEALVARGALYANNNSFSRAMDDFNSALELNSSHVNACKFAVETLVAFGKQYEDQGCTGEAIKCYQKALLLNPSHSEAMHYMKSSQKKAAEQEKARFTGA